LTSVLNPLFEVRFNALIYRFRFLILYIVFGLLSLLFEFFFRSYLIGLGFDKIITTLLAVGGGIFFAFWTNMKFNFKIPRSRRNRALIYFVLISSFSGILQWLLKIILAFDYLSYEFTRLLISGAVFLLAYTLHRKYSFRDFKKVGVAIYANGVEDLENIHRKIGQYPDFIHVDVVDKSMSKNANEVKTYRLETMKAFWPQAQVQSHIMSTQPTKWLDQILPHSDVIYIHAECNENVGDILDLIKQNNKMAGLALTMKTNPDDILELLKKADYVLLLTIPNPGSSGQKFDMDGLDRIKQINKLPFRNQFVVCVDGGVNENIVNMLEVENIVSGSSVLKSPNPRKQIMRLQTVGRYEA